MGGFSYFFHPCADYFFHGNERMLVPLHFRGDRSSTIVLFPFYVLAGISFSPHSL